MKKIGLTILFFFLLIPFGAKADNGYYISDYNIKINVNEDNSYDITENITADFLENRHGIIRQIPLKNTITRNDGTKEVNHPKITEISVNDSYKKYHENDNLVLKIGDSDKIVTGTKDYLISYKYSIGKDKNTDFDELYFNIVGNYWDTEIKKVTFTINMPKEFDSSKIGFSIGDKGTVGYENIRYEVHGNTITGIYDDLLFPYEGINVRLQLPDGYFSSAKINFDYSFIIIISGLLLLLAGSLLLWYKYGRDEKPVETVEFYPPAGYNSAEIGFLYNGFSSSNDVVSLMVYLANKGYIKIEEYKDTKKLLKKDSFKIIKLKDYDGNNESERMFIDGLFTERNEVTEEELKNSFYIVIKKIISKLNQRQNMEKIFEASSLKKAVLVFGMAVIAYLLTVFKPLMEYGGEQTLLILVFPIIMFAMLFMIGTNVSNSKSSIIAMLIIGSSFLILPMGDVLYNSVVTEPFYIILYILGFGILIALLILYYLMPKRNKYGVSILGKIKGFKNFLETAEKEQLEAQVNQNPKYFYDILPYTYVLGVSDTWIKKFETIAIEPPDWYTGDSAFNYITFSTFMSSTMINATSAMTSSPGGSGSSGGGSSGGGSGGGGGSSW